jgi:hypothetical protein
VEWANIKYQLTPELALRAGRIALPVFLAADYRKVGYAYPWVRPPVEVYGSIPLSSSDGVDLSWRWTSWSLRHTTQAFHGHTAMSLSQGARLDARALVGFSHTIESGPFSARLSALSANLTLDVARPLFAALDSFGAAGDALATRYAVERKHTSIVSLGLAYDPGPWFAQGEAGHTHTASFLGKTSTLYASAGLRHGPFTPYLGFSRVRADSPNFDPGLPVAGLPAYQAAAVQTINAGLNALLETVPDQTSISAGVRWDLQRNLALKAQFDRVTPHHGSRGTLINTQPGFVSGRALQVASATLDFVF